MAALHCRQCNEPVVLEGSAFWAEPSGANSRKCGKCGAELPQGDLPDAQPGDAEELGDEAFSALSSGIIDTKRPGANGAAERAAEAEAFARALVRAQLMDAVSDAPPSSRDEEVTVVIGPMSSRAKRAALAKMAAERDAAVRAEQERTLATTPSDELLEMSSPDASDRVTSDRITMDVSSVPTGQNSTEIEERRLPVPPTRPALPAGDDVLEEIEAAPVSDGGTPSLQALIGHPVAMLPQGVRQIPVLDKSRVPKPPERHKDDAVEEEMVESVDLASVEVTEADDSDRESDSDLRSAEAGEIPTLAPTNVTAPPPALSNAAAASRSRWATPLSFAALGSLFAVILAMRTPKSAEEPVAEQSGPPAAVAAMRAPAEEQPSAELAATAPVEQQGESSLEPMPPATGIAPVESEPPATAAEAAAATPPTGAPVAAATVVTVAGATAVKPRARSKAAEATEPFDASAANASLAQAQARASSCRKADDPSGVAQVTITFAPSGRVTTALVAGPPFAGTQTGGCVASTLRSARVPPFLGEPVTVRKTVTIQ